MPTAAASAAGGAPAAGVRRLLQCFSTSRNEGRTWPGIARRANSTAIIGRGSFQERNHDHAQDMQVCTFILSDLLHTGCERPHQSVAKQDAEKCAHQGGGNFVADFFRRPAKSSHGDHNAENGSDNSQAGQGIGHAAQRGDGQAGSVVMNLHVKIEKLIQVKGFDSRDSHAHGVAASNRGRGDL